MKIINKYVLREFIPQFLLGLIVFTFILLMEKIFYLTNLILVKGVAAEKVVKLFLYTLPSLSSLTFPMAFLMGTLLSIGRLQDDNEITAIRAGGIPQFKITLPILMLSLLVSIFMVYFNQNIVPNCQKKFTTFYYDIAYEQPTVKFEENTFVDIENYKIYIKKINRKTNFLKGVVIYKTEQLGFPLLISAKTGLIRQNKDRIALDLNDGIMQQKDRENPAKFTQANFKTYTMTFNLNENNQTQNYAKSIVNLTAKELKSEMKTFAAEKIDITSLKVQYYQRITLAFACFTFVLLASSLAGLGTKHKKSIAFGISLILLFIFYILLALGSSLAEKKILPASIGLLLPNFCLGIVAIYLGIKSNKN